MTFAVPADVTITWRQGPTEAGKGHRYTAPRSTTLLPATWVSLALGAPTKALRWKLMVVVVGGGSVSGGSGCRWL